MATCLITCLDHFKHSREIASRSISSSDEITVGCKREGNSNCRAQGLQKRLHQPYWDSGWKWLQHWILIGVVSPICLLKCKSALSRLNPGEVLDVLVQDEEVVESLSMILKQSQDRMEAFSKEGECYRISIRKG